MARQQSPASRNAFNRLNPEAQVFIHRELAMHTSSEAISERLRLKSGVAVSKNTLYRHIHRDRLSGSKLYLQLPNREKRYRYDTGEPERTPIPDRVGIEFRPAEAELKQQLGHFEIDTVFGKDQALFLLTAVDKATQPVIIRKLPNKPAKSVAEAFSDIVASTFYDFKTLTSDNGSEFA